MLDGFLQIIGGGEIGGEVERARLFFVRPMVLIVGLALLIPLGLLIHRRHRRSLAHVSEPMRALLTGCRVGLLGLLIVIMAGPFARLENSEERKPRLAVLVDESASMDLTIGAMPPEQIKPLALAAGIVEPPGRAGADRPARPVKVTAADRKRLNEMTRRELLAALLKGEAGETVRAMSDRFDVRVYRFATAVREVDLDELGEADAGDAPSRRSTTLGAAMERAMLDAGGREMAGLLIFTDGRSTDGPRPLEVVRRRRRRGVADGAAKVWAVPLASPRRLVDAAVVDLLAPRQVARGDTASVLATLESNGLDQRKAKVELLADDKLVDETEVTLRAAGRQRVQLEYAADEPGERMLTVRVEPQPEEQVTANNLQRAAIGVDSERWKLLVVEGYPRWDFRFLDHGLRRDPGIEPRIIIEAAARDLVEAAAERGDPTPTMGEAAKLPTDAEAWAEYDAVLLGDVSAELLTPGAARQLARAVREEGLGLIVQSGMAHMPHAFTDGPVGELLPVTLAAGDGRSSDDPPGLNAAAYAPFEMTLTAGGAVHPAFSLSGDATRDRELWGRMPPFYWAAAAEEAKPAATVLAEVQRSQRGRPLIVEHFAGRGRVIWLGLDSTYRWRRNVGDHLFYRFWGQALRRVARGKRRDAGASWMEAHPRRAAPGEPVTVQLHAVDDGGLPLRAERAIVKVTGGEAPTTLQLKRIGEAGMFRGTWRTETTGDYALTYNAERGRMLRQRIAVAATDRETREPDADRDTLGAVAAATGGAIVEPTELDRLAGMIEGGPRTERTVREAALWDNWITLVLIVCLYGTDLFVRRMSGLT